MPTTPPNIFAYTLLRDYLAAWFATHEADSLDMLAAWLGNHIGCSRQQVWNILDGVGKVQTKHGPALARALELDEEERDYLTALIAVMNADPRELQEARRTVWTTHAIKMGYPLSDVERLLARNSTPEADEAALLAMLPALGGLYRTPRELAEILVTPPELTTITAALDRFRAGERLGSERSPRLVELGGPLQEGQPDALAWHGLLDQARQGLTRLPPEEREFHIVFCSADQRAVRDAERATRQLWDGLRALVRDCADQPFDRVHMVLVEQMPLTDVLPSTKKRPRPLTEVAGLPVDDVSAKVESASPDPRDDAPGRPCLYLYLDFADFARAWHTWRKAQRRRVSATAQARRMGFKKTLANALSTGATKLDVRHVDAVVKGYGLSKDEAAYVMGLARYTQATDLEERAHLRRALLDFAEAQGVRTLEGETYRARAHWGPSAILALTSLPCFQFHAAWILFALRGRLSLEDVKIALSNLLGAGILAEVPGGPKAPKLTERLSEVADLTALASYPLQDSALHLLQQELLFLSPDQRHRGCVLALPDTARPRLDALLETYEARIKATMKESDARSVVGSPPDRVMLTALQQFPITHPLKTRLVLSRRR